MKSKVYSMVDEMCEEEMKNVVCNVARKTMLSFDF